MDEELLELQRQFEFAQQAKSSIRLSERNVVELVQKLQELQIIDFDLLHTISGKEYITPDQLRSEIVSEINKRGRASLIDLADIVGVDLYHVEKQSQHVVSNDSSLMLINGEIISNSYWDTVSEEINERLQECSQISLAEIAGQLQVGSELIVSVLQPRLGTLVKGRLEGGQLYTPAYVARVSAMVRGAARGIAVPMNLSAWWSSLQALLQDMDGFSGVVVESSFSSRCLMGWLRRVRFLARFVLEYTGHLLYVFAMAQKECVDSFFSQNSFIGYETLHKLGIPQPIQFLQSRYPEGKPLATAFAHGSLIEMLDAAVEDAIERGSWIDSLTILPTSFASQDASKILSLCPSVQRALKSSKAHMLGESYIFSDTFVKVSCHWIMGVKMDKYMLGSVVQSGAKCIIEYVYGPASRSELELPQNLVSVVPAFTFVLHEGETKTNHSDIASYRGLMSPFGLFDSIEKELENLNITGITTAGSLGGPHVIKDARLGHVHSSSLAETDEYDNQSGIGKSASEKGSKKKKEKQLGMLKLGVSDSKSGAKKDTDRLDNPSFLSEESLIQKIMLLIPDLEEQGMDDPETILAPLANYLRPMLLNSWMERRKVIFTENAQKMKRVLDDLQRKLDEAFLNIQLYEKALDLFEDDQSTADMHNKLKNGIQLEESQDHTETVSMSSADRIALAKGLPGSLSVKAVALVESLEGKRVEIFISAVKDLARKIHGKALQAPGRAISVAISRLKDKLDDLAFKTLADYQSAAVNLLSLISAGTGNEEDCTSDRILSKRELLEGSMPALKSLVLGNSSQA
ncbi:hypothetical protein DH2020_000096 [Rehmannia glutinosa]|uniref:E3 UFM1-protein ligase 1-like protein n=1 Tax=Rehmannia glutinosa TaxID=99300 RepID=A0ABR0XVM4_REHGL